LSKKKVLIVDDEKELVEVTQVLLESNGFEVAAAYSGADGKQAAVAEKPDVIILDVMMETTSAGFDVARWLREQVATKQIPIIMLTAVNQNVPWRFGTDEVWLPVDVFLDKPVSPEKLLREVKKITGGK
jgi:CheY-like chemotaxis protein